jgi:hypothetical protein
MNVPPNLTGPQARVLMQTLELLIDTLIELYTELQRNYDPWGEPEPTDDLR